MKKALVTGGAGFIGSHLSEELLKQGYEVYALDDFSTGSINNIKGLLDDNKFHFTEGSVLDKATLSKLIDDVDVIFHLAAAVGVKYILENPLKSLRINIHGTDNVLELASRDKKKVVIASSSEIYGKNNAVPFKETDDRVLGSTHIPRWGYSSSKAVDEFLAFAYHRELGLPVVIVRFFNTVGPRQSSNYGMVIPVFVSRALRNEEITIFGDGRQSRCFAHVADVVDAVIKLSEHPDAVGHVFNIGSDDEITILDLANKIIKLTNSSSKIKFLPYNNVYSHVNSHFEDMRRRVPHLSRVKNLIGYSPRFNIDDILRDTIDYYSKSA